jgi:putative hydrolase of the HAD superfamily
MKAVLFDLGHTLIDYHHEWKGPEARAVDRVYRIVTEACDATPDEKEFTAHLSRSLEEARERKITEMVEVPLYETLGTCFHRFGCDFGEDLIVDSMDAFYQTLLETRELIPGAVEMLERVKDRGLLVGLVSDVAWGLPSEYPLKDMKYFQLDGYFDDMVFSTDVGLRKPNPRIFKIALWNLGVKPADSAFIGNSLQADIRGAKGVGMFAVLKDSKYYQHDDNITPDAKIADWSEIDSLLDGRRD